MAKLKPIRILLSGLGNVVQELQIADQIIEDWNRLHGEGFGVVVQSWGSSTIPYPAAWRRPWGVTTKQIIENAHLFVTILRSRQDATAANSESGTLKVTRHRIAKGEYSITFISDLELEADSIAEEQEPRVKLRESYRKNMSYATFLLRTRFKRMFAVDLARALNTLIRTNHGRRTPLIKPPTTSQTAGMP